MSERRAGATSDGAIGLYMSRRRRYANLRLRLVGVLGGFCWFAVVGDTNDDAADVSFRDRSFLRFDKHGGLSKLGISILNGTRRTTRRRDDSYRSGASRGPFVGLRVLWIAVGWGESDR